MREHPLHAGAGPAGVPRSDGLRPASRWALPAVLGLGLGLRLLGLGFGLPAVYNPDEIAIMSRALAFGTGDLNPHNFLYPTFFFYLLFGWVGLLFVAGWIGGAYASVGAFQEAFFRDPSAVYLAGRLLGALAGTATILVVYRLGRTLVDRRTGLMAALLLAVSPLHVQDSHYVKHDVTATLAIAVALLAYARLVRTPEPGREGSGRQVAAAGLATGVAFAIHYYTIFLLVPLTVVIWWWAGRARRRIIASLATAGVAAALTFFALSPFVLLEPDTALRDIRANRQIVVDRGVVEGSGTFGNAAEYARLLVLDGTGIVTAALALLGIGLMGWRQPRVALLLLGFAGPFLLFISNTAVASRYLNPVLPAAVLFAAYGIAQAGRQGRRLSGPTIGALLVVAALPNLAHSIRIGLFFRQTDTRTQALRFIESHVPAGATILIQPYSVPLVQSDESLREALARHLGDASQASTKFRLRLQYDEPPGPAYRTIYLGEGGLDVDKIYVGYGAGEADPLAPLGRIGVEYVVLKRFNEPDPSTLPFIESLERRAERIALFSPYRPEIPADEQARIEPFLHNTDARISDTLERPGPVIEIWRLRTDG